MPIALSPDPYVWIVLDSDCAMPEDARPAYRCHFPTVRQVIQINSLIKEASAEKDQAKLAELLKRAIGTVVDGHRNIPGDFSADDLDAVLTSHELWELAYGVLHETRLEEKKRVQSGSELRPGADPSANAPPASATPPAAPEPAAL